MRKFQWITVLLIMISFVFINQSEAQIWEPEGINMPGAWNGWTNPPTNNMALASYTQVAGGLVTKISDGTSAHWNTVLHVAVGGDVVAGNYEWLFTSGPAGSPWNNKWAGANVIDNTIQNYTFNAGANNNVTLVDNMWYTVNWEDIGYFDSRAIFMPTSASPVEILTVSEPANVLPGNNVDIDITVAAPPCPEENFFIRYTIDNWTTSAVADVIMVGATGTATLPSQITNTLVKYYALSSTIVGLAADFDLQTLKMNNNGAANYSYTIGAPPPPTIDWVNLQWPENGAIDEGQDYVVYGQIYMNGITDPVGQGADIQAWIGYSSDNTNPATWTNWIPASYLGDVGNNDEYNLNLGTAINQSGTFYYATRFQYDAQGYVYGGYNGGFWDGTNNVNGTLVITSPIPLSNWAFGLFGLLFLTFVFIKMRR